MNIKRHLILALICTLLMPVSAFADDLSLSDLLSLPADNKLVNAINPPAVVAESATGTPICCCIYEFTGPPKTYKGACHTNYCKVTDLGNYVPDKKECPKEFPKGKRTVYYYTATGEKGYFRSW